jgi:hypothetical protein
LLSSLKSDIVCTVWSFFGMMKEGKAVYFFPGEHTFLRSSISFLFFFTLGTLPS